MRTIPWLVFGAMLLSASGCKKQFPCTERSLPPAIVALGLPDVEACQPRLPGVGYGGIVRGKSESAAWISIVGAMQRAGWVRISQAGPHGGRFERDGRTVRILLSLGLEFAGPPVLVAIELEEPGPPRAR